VVIGQLLDSFLVDKFELADIDQNFSEKTPNSRAVGH
jgi:hypothetical protein